MPVIRSWARLGILLFFAVPPIATGNLVNVNNQIMINYYYYIVYSISLLNNKLVYYVDKYP